MGGAVGGSAMRAVLVLLVDVEVDTHVPHSAGQSDLKHSAKMAMGPSPHTLASLPQGIATSIPKHAKMPMSGTPLHIPAVVTPAVVDVEEVVEVVVVAMVDLLVDVDVDVEEVVEVVDVVDVVDVEDVVVQTWHCELSQNTVQNKSLLRGSAHI
jgi:hypothetical protein